MATLWDSYTSPRALALFSQLEENLAYLETHRIPEPKTDVTADDGVVYRYFSGKGLEFHPLAEFAALNGLAAAQDADGTRALADALLARAIPRGRGLVWEYSFPFGSGRPPWTSGMAQAVAAQALARAGALLEDPSLVTAAARAFQAIRGSLVLPLEQGPWIRLYGFNREIVLNAQLQAIVSLGEYARAAGDPNASALAASLAASAQALLPRFDTGDWSLYELGGAAATRDYETLVTSLLGKLAAQTADPFWVDAAQRFHDYLYTPAQVVEGAPPPHRVPAAARRLARHGRHPDHAVEARLADPLGRGEALDVPAERRRPRAHVEAGTGRPAGDVPGADLDARPRRQPRDVQARAGRRRLGHRAAADHGRARRHGGVVAVDRSRLAVARAPGAADRPGRRESRRRRSSSAGSRMPAARRRAESQLAVPPGTWQAALTATNSAGQTATVQLGTVTAPG